MSSGRSRGRARTRSEQQPTAPTLGQTTTPVPPPQVPQPQVPPPPVAPPTTTIQQPQRPPTTTTPRTQVVIEAAGRGRGAEPAVQPTPPQSSIATSATSTSNGESPPQQPSPPQKSSPPAPAPQSIGRATLRGGPHQPGVTVRTELIGAMERLALQEGGEGGARVERRPDRVETVPYTRPASCVEKTGYLLLFFKLLLFF